MIEVIRPFPEAEQVVLRNSHKLMWKDDDAKPFLSGQVESNLINLNDALIDKIYSEFLP